MEKESDNRNFTDMFKDLIKECVNEAVSQYLPVATSAEATMPLTLTVPQFCEQMNVSRSVAYDMINSEGFPSFRVGTNN